MELLTLLVADFANVAGEKLNVMGIFNQIKVTRFPAPLPLMFVVARFSASAAESGLTRQITFKLLDEDASELVNIPGELKVPDKLVTAARYEMNMIFNLQGVVFPKAGTYQISVLVDNDEKGSVPIYLTLLEQPKQGN